MDINVNTFQVSSIKVVEIKVSFVLFNAIDSKPLGVTAFSQGKKFLHFISVIKKLSLGKLFLV